MARLADAMKDAWITGTANASYEVRGECAPAFWTSAEGTLRFDLTNGSLPHVLLAEDAQPLSFVRFAGQAGLQAGGVEIKDAKLNSPDGVFELSGKASLKRELDFTLASTSNGTKIAAYAIGGTLAAPLVTSEAHPETQARLKSAGTNSTH
jgi:hypothetical protein